jgi:Tfp pilus assembly major pilin PilA
MMVALASTTACVTVKPPSFLEYPAVRDWGQTLRQAQSLAANGQPSQADSLLATYAAQYPDAPQTREASYWRALLGLRSSVANQGISVAIPLLQSYIAAGQTTEHWMEASALLQAAVRLDSLSRTSTTYVSRGDVTTDAATNAKVADAKAEARAATADSKAQDDEIRRLKDELAKSKDELERIKKRLAEPPKKPPYP